MKKPIITLIVLAIFMVFSAYAGFRTGNDLMEEWKAYQKIDQGKVRAVDNFDSGRFMGYVTGVLDLYEGVDLILYIKKLGSSTFEVPNGVPLGQICRIVGKYLNDHPERLHESGAVLILSALKEAFPKNK